MQASSRESYSFIQALESDSVLKPYGDNSLPLFAVALLLGVEDMRTFAFESLTDHSSDKKVDIIYIDESVGVACIAQGYTSQSWGKHQAPANKASDLNTAVTWLLQVPISSVPEAIRSQAQILRSALEVRSIAKLVLRMPIMLMRHQTLRKSSRQSAVWFQACPVVRVSR